jgi:signal transduction histidine kinase
MFNQGATASIVAPVSYAEVRTAGRLSRASLGFILLILAAAGWAGGIPGVLIKATAAALVILHAVLDRPTGKPLFALSLDALLLCVAGGMGSQTQGPLVGVVAYVLAAAVLLLPRRLVPVVAAALGGGVALRLLVLPSPAGGDLGAILAGIESGMYVVALALLILGAAVAITRARGREVEALAAEQRAATIKDEFATMVSHELRTPLTNIAGFALALKESWRSFDPTEVDEFLDVMCREADHLRALVDDVLVVPRLEADKLLIEPADFPLRPAAFRIADLVFPAGGDKSVSVSVGGSAVVRADPNRVQQVLRNLLENAARHGGSQVSIEAAFQNGEWLVVVADDGPGIDPAHRDRIFGAFEQAAAHAAAGHGLGLGLTVSRVLVEAMGGRIWYEPGFPTGARFCFTLPAAAPSGVPVPAVS